MKHKVTPDFAISCLENFLGTVDGKRNSAYKVASETRLTPSTISNYMNGRSKPSGRSLEVLNYYFRLDEYAQYLDDADQCAAASEEGVVEYMPFVDWIEEKGVRPVVVVSARQKVLAGYLGGDATEPQAQNTDPVAGPDTEGPLFAQTDASEYEEALEAAREQIDALHALVLAQKKTIDNQKREIERLTEKLKEKSYTTAGQ